MGRGRQGKFKRELRKRGLELPSLSSARMRPELQAMAKAGKVVREAPMATAEDGSSWWRRLRKWCGF